MADQSITPNRVALEIRKARGLGLKQVAAKAGFGVAYLSQIENGNRPFPHDRGGDIARSLGVPAAVFDAAAYHSTRRAVRHSPIIAWAKRVVDAEAGLRAALRKHDDEEVARYKWVNPDNTTEPFGVW